MRIEHGFNTTLEEIDGKRMNNNYADLLATFLQNHDFGRALAPGKGKLTFRYETNLLVMLS
jgi:hypothetical protein